MAAVTIDNLHVRFELEADDLAVFGRLFEQHIRAWSERQERELAQRRHTAQECSVGDGAS